MKKTLLAAVSVSVLALSACGGGNTGTNGAGSTGGDGETVILTAAHQLAQDTPFDEGLNKLAELVEEKTGGTVKVEVYPNAQLGNETEVFQSLENGTVDLGIFAPGSIAEYYPGLTLLSMPFLISDLDHRDRILESDAIKSLGQGLTDTTGNEVLTYFGGSNRQMFFTEPADSIADLEGRLIRVQPSEMLTQSYLALGLEPSVVAYNELYNALQQGVVEGAENEPVFIVSQKFFEAAPHILLTNHEVTFRPVIGSPRMWDKVTEEQKSQILEAIQEAGEFERTLEAQKDQEYLAELDDLPGTTVTEVDVTEWTANMNGIWTDFATQWGVSEQLAEIISLKE